MAPETIATRTAEIRVRDDGITQVTTLPNLREGVEDAKEIISTVYRINQGKAVPVLVDIRPGPGIDRETRDYYSSKEGLVATKALALLVHSQFQQVMANFFIGVNQPTVPTRLFTSEDQAVAWLKSFIK